MKRDIGLFMVGLGIGMIIGVLLSTPANADECPPDRPFKRFVTGFPSGVTLNNLAMVYCPPRLVCQTDSDRCSYVAGCPVPKPVEQQLCLSQDELDKAK